jgi:hypothetical protein
MLPVSIDRSRCTAINKLARVEPSCCLKNLFANSVLVLTENVSRYYEVLQ